MQIGGRDIQLSIQGDAAPVIIAAARQVWPELVFEDADAPDNYYACTVPMLWLPKTHAVEFFLYRDLAAARGIDKVGVTDELDDAYIHVIDLGGGKVTVVVSARQDSDGARVVDLLRQVPV